MFAEAAYLFRHALLRDAAYQLQLPADRAALHALALEIIEGLYGGNASISLLRASSCLAAPLPFASGDVCLRPFAVRAGSGTLA